MIKKNRIFLLLGIALYAHTMGVLAADVQNSAPPLRSDSAIPYTFAGLSNMLGSYWKELCLAGSALVCGWQWYRARQANTALTRMREARETKIVELEQAMQALVANDTRIRREVAAFQAKQEELRGIQGSMALQLHANTAAVSDLCKKVESYQKATKEFVVKELNALHGTVAGWVHEAVEQKLSSRSGAPLRYSPIIRNMTHNTLFAHLLPNVVVGASSSTSSASAISSVGTARK